MKKLILMSILVAVITLFSAFAGEVELTPGKSGLIPNSLSVYKLVQPPMLYHTRRDGPKDQPTQKAWRLANEFVYRTALRESVELPSVSQSWTGGVCIVTYRSKKGDEDLRIMVDIGEQTLRVMENHSFSPSDLIQ